jgi:hypothetical protein
MPSVGSHIQALQVLDWRLAGTSILYHPLAELFHRFQIEVAGLSRDAVTIVSQVSKVSLHLTWLHVRPRSEFAAYDYSFYSRSDLVGLFKSIALR